MIRPSANDADIDAVLRIPAREPVEAIDSFAAIKVIERALPIDLERVLVARDIYRSPPDVILRIRMLDNALVVWRTSRLGAGVRDERSIFRDAGVFLVAN